MLIRSFRILDTMTLHAGKIKLELLDNEDFYKSLTIEEIKELIFRFSQYTYFCQKTMLERIKKEAKK